MISRMAFSLLLASLLASPLTRAADLSELDWLVGAWGHERDGRWSEERWSPARGGVMLGTGRTGKGQRTTGFEFMRIALDDAGTPVFWGSPQGAPAVPFAMTSLTEATVVFENPQHDFPKVIRYEKTATGLKASVSGNDGQGLSWAWTALPR